MFSGIPFLEGREALRHCGEKTNNDFDGRALHLVTKIVNQSPFLD